MAGSGPDLTQSLPVDSHEGQSEASAVGAAQGGGPHWSSRNTDLPRGDGGMTAGVAGCPPGQGADAEVGP